MFILNLPGNPRIFRKIAIFALKLQSTSRIFTRKIIKLQKLDFPREIAMFMWFIFVKQSFWLFLGFLAI